MGSFDIPYLQERKQKSGKIYFYWEPSKKLRVLGYKSISLGNNQQKAITEAQTLNIKLYNDSDPIVKGSIDWLIKQYKEEPAYYRLAKNTKRGYDNNLKLISNWSGKYKIEELTRKICISFYNSEINKIKTNNPNDANAGLTHAKSVLTTLRLLLNLAVDEGYLDINPAKQLKLKQPKPREEVWTEEEMNLFVDKAIILGRRSLALAFMIGKYCGQRPGDIRRLNWSQYDGKSLFIKQRKTGASVKIKCMPELKRMIDKTTRNSILIVVSEETSRPYKDSNFTHWIEKVRDAEIKDNNGKITHPRINRKKQFRDLRRTAVVNLVRAGATTQEIVSITGHSTDGCQSIIDTYFPKDSISASHGIDKLNAYKKKNNDGAATE